MKKNKLRMAACVLLVSTVLVAFVAIATEVGSQNDPLVTLSYLNETFLGQIMETVDEKLTTRNEEIHGELALTVDEAKEDILSSMAGVGGGATGGTSASFVVVELETGMTLYGEAGCEVMLRGGSAECVSKSGDIGMVDGTDGATLGNGALLAENHLYMMVTARGVRAVAGNVTLLVRGRYIIQ